MPVDRERDVILSEAVQIRLHRGESWLRKSRAARAAKDLDAQFIFLWIAFNALYGRPRYRRDVDSDETKDFTDFLRTVEQVSRNQVATALRQSDIEAHVEKILQSPFLNIECWRYWDRKGIRDRGKRTAVSCNNYDKGHRIEQLFRQLYTLRNQILHGAATDSGKRNRESLTHAIPVLDTSVDSLLQLIKKHHAKIPGLEPVPFPPSVGEGGRFNPPRFV
jgi:hypothetical protein